MNLSESLAITAMSESVQYSSNSTTVAVLGSESASASGSDSETGGAHLTYAHTQMQEEGNVILSDSVPAEGNSINPVI